MSHERQVIIEKRSIHDWLLLFLYNIPKTQRTYNTETRLRFSSLRYLKGVVPVMSLNQREKL